MASWDWGARRECRRWQPLGSCQPQKRSCNQCTCVYAREKQNVVQRLPHDPGCGFKSWFVQPLLGGLCVQSSGCTDIMQTRLCTLQALKVQVSNGCNPMLPWPISVPPPTPRPLPWKGCDEDWAELLLWLSSSRLGNPQNLWWASKLKAATTWRPKRTRKVKSHISRTMNKKLKYETQLAYGIQIWKYTIHLFRMNHPLVIVLFVFFFSFQLDYKNQQDLLSFVT